MKRRLRKAIIILAGIIGSYMFYVFLTGVLLFSAHQPSINYDARTFQLESTNDRIILLEESLDAGVARINLIENATSALDVAYFTTHEGKARDLFFSSIIDAADRGVKVRIILDGIFHNLDKVAIYAFESHSNIEFKLYEPFDPLRPWTWNNRLHDKLMIVDTELAMLGGRNIGDPYFAPVGFAGAKKDRDVIVVNHKKEDNSVIGEMKTYYDHLWDHKFSRQSAAKLSKKQRNKGDETLAKFRLLLTEFQTSHPHFFNQKLNWVEKSFETTSIQFIYNPIQRLNKEPIVWLELVQLMETAEKSIVVQSPYLIPTKRMLDHLNKSKVTAQASFLTNSLASTPNIPAYSGYMKYRKKLADAGTLYEYQSQNESLHGKTFLFDDKISAVGTFNLDPRSTFLSTESMLIIESKELNAKINDEIRKLQMEESLLVGRDGSYVDHPRVEQGNATFMKKLATKSLSVLFRLFHHML